MATDSIPCSFTHLVVSLSQSALVAMGDVKGPQQQPTDLRLARYNLDLLRLLQEKTKGNLDTDEQRLIDAMVKEVAERMAVRASA
jgi:hypothetical protein